MNAPILPVGRPTVLASIRRVEAVVNPTSGGVGPQAPEELRNLLAEFGLEAAVSVPAPADVEAAVRAAVAARPDLVITLAGDGTARLAAQLCGAHGPLFAPLPGGTMNMLPRALYGDRVWQSALTDALTLGAERPVSGGEIGGHRFYCAAIIGAPALLGRAREAMRAGRPARAWGHVVFAFRRAFLSRLRFQLDRGPRRKAVALGLICPLISRAFDEEDRALEAAVIDVRDAMETFRLGLNNMLGDWRSDPAVSVQPCLSGWVWAHGSIPALLDGELHRLGRAARLRFVPHAFRALAPPP